MKRALLCLLVACAPPIKADVPPVLVSFADLREGQVFTRVDDTVPGLDGVQVDIAVRIGNTAADAPVTLMVGPLVVTQPAVDARAVFTQITLPFGDGISVVAQVGDVSTELHLDVHAEGAVCAFVEPLSGALFTVARTDLVVMCEGLPDNATLDLGIKGRRLQTVGVDASGRASLAALQLAEGPSTLRAENPLLARPAEIEVIVDTGRCVATLLPEDGTAFVYDSARDGPGGVATPARSLRLQTTCALGSDVQLQLVQTGCSDGSVQHSEWHATVSTLADGSSGADIPLTLLPGAISASATVQAPDGQHGEALANSYEVDALPPALGSIVPSNGSVLEVVGGMLVVQTQVAGIEVGTVQRLFVTGADGITTEYPLTVSAISAGTCAGGRADLSFTINAPDGLTELRVLAIDKAGNISTVSAEVSLLVAIPTLVISAPADGAALSLHDDVDAMTPGLQLDVVVSASGGSVIGAAGSLSFTGQTPAFFTFSSNPQTVRVTLADGPPPDGRQGGIVAAARYATGRTVSSLPVAWTVDATPPFLRVTAPRDGDAVVSAALSVDVQLSEELDERELRIFVNDMLAASQTIAAGGSAGAQLFASLPVTLMPGLNVVRVEADDHRGTGSNTAVQSVSVYFASGPPTLSWQSVSSTDADNTASNGYDVNATLRIGGAPGPALIELRLTDQSASDGAGGTPWGHFLRRIPAAATGPVSIDFSLAAHEPLRVWARVTETPSLPGALASAWVSFDFNVDPRTPAVPLRITSPSADARVGGSTLAVTLATNTTNKTCTATIDATDLASLAGVASATPAINVPLSTLNDGAHTLLVRCDSGGGPFYSQRVAFTYESRTPVLAFIDSPGVMLESAPGFINASAQDSSASAGFQHDISASVAGIDGSSMSLTVTSRSDSSVLAAVTAPLVAGVAVFRSVTLAATVAPPGDAIRLVLAYTDPVFGALTATRDASVDRVLPTITVDGCPASIPRFNSFDDASTFDIIEYKPRFTTVGVDDGAAFHTRVSVPAGSTDVASSVQSTLSAPLLPFAVSGKSVSNASFQGSAADAAGNIGSSSTCVTKVDPTVPALSFRTERVSFFDPPLGQPFTTEILTASQDDIDLVTAGLQTNVLVTLVNIDGGATVHLCSTSPDASLASAPACTRVPGKVLASAVSVQTSVGVSQAIFSHLSLVDSGTVPYGLAAEIVGSTGVTPAQDTPPRRAYPVIVDTALPPPVTALSTPENISSNDTASALQLGANVWDGASLRAEGTLVAGAITPSSLTFTLGAGSFGTASEVASASLAGSDTFGPATISAGSISFAGIALSEGTHTLTLTMTSSNGNTRQVAARIVVDLTPPVILVAAPAEAPYVCELAGSCLSASGRTTTISLAISDNESLAGGCACVRTGSTPCLSSHPLCAGNTLLGSGTSALPDIDLALAEGTSLVRGEAADAVGNVTVASAVSYSVDTLATLGAPGFEVSANAGACSAFSVSGCAIPFDDGATDCRDDGSDPGNAASPPPRCPHWYASNVYRLTTTGTQTTACQISGDGCAYGVRLLGTPLDDSGGALAGAREVYLSKKIGLAADLNRAFIETLAPAGAAGLDNAHYWKLVLEARDRWGNIAWSAPRFVELPGRSGVVVELARGFDTQGGQEVGQVLQADDAFGVRHNSTIPASATNFTTTVRAALSWSITNRPAAPRCVQLAVDDSATTTFFEQSSTEMVAAQETIDFAKVSLPTNKGPFTLRATVHVDSTCTSATIGTARVTGITSTNTLPALAWNRSWLEAARFNVLGDGKGNTPGTVVRALAGSGTEATGLIYDGGGAPGLQFGVSRPLAVDVTGAVSGSVRIQSTVAASGTTMLAVAADGTQTFPWNLTLQTAVTAGAPATTDTQDISAIACNKAGDCVTTPAPLQMRINVDRPQTVSDTIVCFGTGTAPSPGPTAPDSNAAYVDDPACASLCTATTCDLRSGKAVIRFTAPGVAQSSVGTVSGYAVAVAIIDAANAASTTSACNALVSSGTTDPTSLYATLAPHAIAAPGSPQTLALSGLPLHQRLCVAVLAYDDLGNTSVAASVIRVAALLPVSAAPRPFVRSADPDRSDDSLVPLDQIVTGVANSVVLAALNVGDMDGDGGDEFAVATDLGEVRLYSSKRTRNAAFTPAPQRFKPRETITAPGPSTAFAQQFAGASFKGGASMAGGDFNGDGFADIAIASPAGVAPDGTRSGTVYIYFGSGNSAGADPALLKKATCAFPITVPSPQCPHVIIYGGNGSTDPFFNSYGFLGWEVRAAKVHAATGADDLILADPGAFNEQGGVYVIAGGGALFPATAPASTVIVDLRTPSAYTAQVTALGPLTGCDNDKFELSLAVADLDGDGIEDISASYGNGIMTANSCALLAEVLFWKGGSTIAAAAGRCDQIPVVNTANMQNAGHFVSPTADALLVRSDNQIRVFGGAPDFFAPGSACAAVAERLTVQVLPMPKAITRFGAALDDACNASGQTHTFGTANDVFHFAGSAARAGDWNGDGLDEIFLAESGPRSRVYVVSASTPRCGTAQSPFRVLAEITGNIGSANEGFGVHLFNAGTHTGVGASALGAAGRIGSGSDDLGVWLLR